MAAKRKSVLFAWAFQLLALFAFLAAGVSASWAKTDFGPKNAPGEIFCETLESTSKIVAQVAETHWENPVADSENASGFTYNFEVEDAHTYFVGTQGILVHNMCVVPTVSKVGNLISQVKAKITLANLYGGTGTTKQARNAAHPGDDAGHIIGRLLGGKGGITSDNIFSQNPHINRGAFAQHEGWVADQVRAGHNVEVDVQLNWNASGTRVDGITYDTYVNGVLDRATFGN